MWNPFRVGMYDGPPSTKKSVTPLPTRKPFKFIQVIDLSVKDWVLC